MRKKCRIKIRKGLSPFEGGYFEERFGRGDGWKAFGLDDLWGEKGEEVVHRLFTGGRGFRLKLNDIILNILKLEYLEGGIRLWWNEM